MKSKQPLSNPRQNIHVGHKDKKSVPMNGQMQSKSKLASSGNPNLSMMRAKKQLGNSNGNGPGRPLGNSNNGNGPGRPMVAPKASSAVIQKKPSLPDTKNSVPGVRKPLPPKKLEDKRNDMRPPAKAKVAPSRPVSSSRPQVICLLMLNWRSICLEIISLAGTGRTTLDQLCNETTDK